MLHDLGAKEKGVNFWILNMMPNFYLGNLNLMSNLSTENWQQIKIPKKKQKLTLLSSAPG